MMSVHVRTDAALTGNAAADAALVVRALRAGHLYMAIDGAATPPAFEFSATNGQGTVHEGDELGAGGPVALRVRSDAPASFTTIVGSDRRACCRPIITSRISRCRRRASRARTGPRIVATGRPGAAPWIVSNPIYVRGDQAAAPPARRPAGGDDDNRSSTGRRRTAGGSNTTPRRWPRSTSRRSSTAPRCGCDTRLAEARPPDRSSRWRARPRRAWRQNDRLTFTARAEHPMRISVQLRAAAGSSGAERWQRSVYVDAFDEEHTIGFDDLRPVDAASAPQPVLANVRSLMFVIDTVNTRPGASGRLWLKAVALGAVYVRTVRIRYAAAAPKRMFGAHAASIGGTRPPEPIAAKTLIAIQ